MATPVLPVHLVVLDGVARIGFVVSVDGAVNSIRVVVDAAKCDSVLSMIEACLFGRSSSVAGRGCQTLSNPRVPERLSTRSPSGVLVESLLPPKRDIGDTQVESVPRKPSVLDCGSVRDVLRM